jgi:hypothetical protein
MTALSEHLKSIEGDRDAFDARIATLASEFSVAQLRAIALDFLGHPSIGLTKDGIVAELKRRQRRDKRWVATDRLQSRIRP